MKKKHINANVIFGTMFSLRDIPCTPRSSPELSTYQIRLVSFSKCIRVRLCKQNIVTATAIEYIAIADADSITLFHSS